MERGKEWVEGRGRERKRKKPSQAVGELLNAVLVIYHTDESKEINSENHLSFENESRITIGQAE